MEGPETEVEAQEVHDVAVEEGAFEKMAAIVVAEKAVGEIAKDAGDQQRHGSAAQLAWKHAFAMHRVDEGQRGEWDDREEVLGVHCTVAHAEGHAGIRSVMQPEDAGDDFLLGFVEFEMLHDPALGELVEDVQRQ